MTTLTEMMVDLGVPEDRVVYQGSLSGIRLAPQFLRGIAGEVNDWGRTAFSRMAAVLGDLSRRVETVAEADTMMLVLSRMSRAITEWRASAEANWPGMVTEGRFLNPGSSATRARQADKVHDGGSALEVLRSLEYDLMARRLRLVEVAQLEAAAIVNEVVERVADLNQGLDTLGSVVEEMADYIEAPEDVRARWRNAVASMRSDRVAAAAALEILVNRAELLVKRLVEGDLPRLVWDVAHDEEVRQKAPSWVALAGVAGAGILVTGGGA